MSLEPVSLVEAARAVLKWHSEREQSANMASPPIPPGLFNCLRAALVEGMAAPGETTERAHPTLLQRAEQLWKDLQEDNLGGFSGINRPFWIVQAFKEVEAAVLTATKDGARRTALIDAAHVVRAQQDSEHPATYGEIAKAIVALATPGGGGTTDG